MGVAPYLLASVGAEYALSRTALLYARLQNALDAEYETAFDRPGAPVTLFVGARVDTGAGER